MSKYAPDPDHDRLGSAHPFFNPRDERVAHLGAGLERDLDPLALSGRKIVSFSELGDYLHLPIRTYSIGMRVRLAFAIATAHEPEILLLDELIGVGDARFVHRAQERLARHVLGAGIVVLATHATEVIRQVCGRALLLHQGRLLEAGPVESVLETHAKLIDN